MVMLIQVLLPVLLIFAAGFLGQKIFKLHIKSLTTTALYLMTPPLIFRTFYTAKLDAGYLNILVYSLVLSAVLIAVIKIVSSWRKYSSVQAGALISSAAFMNNGNFGAPLMLFAYGQAAFDYAIAIMVLHAIVMSTVGLYYVARGNFNVKKSLISVAKMPIVHAVYIGLLWQYLHLPLPENIYSAVSMVADASIILTMLALGMQLAEIKLVKIQWDLASIGILVRLFLSPAIAYILTLLLPVEPMLAKVMIILGAMPSAAIMVMYSIEFDCEPQLVSSITLLSTLFSILTLSVLLTVL
ncbi:MAG: AEC family transporter [Clostridia bacterium]|jgi:predicted permease|nr:AEC family transporter [Clostridia bacterium]